MDNNSLSHHGILGQRWGIRRTPEQLGHLSKQDQRFAKRKSGKITAQVQKSVQPELRAYQKELVRQPGAYKTNGRLSSATINAYNRRMAELMNQKAADMRSPSGKVIQFVAKRGEIGVYMALADEGYNMSQMKNGVWGNGRIAYRKTVVDQVKVDT